MSEIAIIAYNAGNTLSVLSALSRLGANAIVTDDKEFIRKSSRIIFPGVGHAAPAAQYLKLHGLDTILKQATQPVLGICLGMQLLCQHSEEGETTGLGVFDANCRRFKTDTQKIPHMGWNSISNLKGKLFCNISEQSYVYFVHSYRIDCCNHTSGLCNYEGPFSAALERDNFYGVQFHPEKSSTVGSKILENFLKI